MNHNSHKDSDDSLVIVGEINLDAFVAHRNSDFVAAAGMVAEDAAVDVFGDGASSGTAAAIGTESFAAVGHCMAVEFASGDD
jgi:hypothetical protein